MDNQFVHVLNPKTLLKLMKALRAMATNQARIIENGIMMEPHCNDRTSLARYLATREVCGCFDELLFSTNKETQGGKFRKEVAGLIIKLIQDGFTEQAKLDLYRRGFPDAIKAHAKRYSNELADIPSFVKYITQKQNWDDISLKDIAELETELRQHLINHSHKPKIAAACKQVLIRLDDISRICNELRKHKELCQLILKQPSFGERYESAKNLHCELAALERDGRTRTHDFEKLIDQISEKVKTKEFTVSKFSCYLCSLVFSAFGIVKNVDFTHLGNSGTIYPDYGNLQLPNIPIVQQVIPLLETAMQNLIGEIERGNCRIQPPSCIENSHINGASFFKEPCKEPLEQMATLSLN
jgi:hypothetical protein